MRQFETGATRDSNEDKLDYKGFVSAHATELFAEYMHKHRKQADGSMRGSDNWKLGIPPSAYLESQIRHTFDLMKAAEAGDWDTVEELQCAIWFNTQGWLHERATWRARQAKLDDIGAKLGIRIRRIPWADGGKNAAESELRDGGDSTSGRPRDHHVVSGEGNVPRGQSPVEAVTGQTAGLLRSEDRSGRGDTTGAIFDGKEGSPKVGTRIQYGPNRDLFHNCR